MRLKALKSKQKYEYLTAITNKTTTYYYYYNTLLPLLHLWIYLIYFLRTRRNFDSYLLEYALVGGKAVESPAETHARRLPRAAKSRRGDDGTRVPTSGPKRPSDPSTVKPFGYRGDVRSGDGRRIARVERVYRKPIRNSIRRIIYFTVYNYNRRGPFVLVF
jgi:hypothetical protein